MVAASILVCEGCGTSGGRSTATSPPVVNGVRLVRAPAPVHRSCVVAARRLRAVIYCPTRVPPKWGTQMLVCAGCNGTFSATGSFPAPRGYVGAEYRTGHFSIWAEPRRLIRQWYVGCPDARVLGRIRVGGLEMAWTTCPSGSELDSGHVLLGWSRNGWRYALSLHSNTPTNRRLLRVMAAHLVQVR